MKLFAILLTASVTTQLQPVGIFGDADRRTEDVYARENGMTLAAVQKRYAATGRLECDGNRLTANLVMRNDIILTSAHGLFDEKTCKRKSEPAQCKFVFRVANVTQEVRVKSLQNIGWDCPRTAQRTEDWAILRLDKDVTGVIPYSIDASLAGAIQDNQKIISINALNIDFYIGDHRLSDQTKTIGNCSSRKVYRDGSEPVFFSSDCDVSLGGSGGAILRTSNLPPVLLGLTKETLEKSDQVEMGLKSGVPNSGPFVEAKWAAYHVPIRGKLLQALLKYSDGAVANAISIAPFTFKSVGLDVLDISDDLRRKYDIPDGPTGAVIMHVEEGTPALTSGFKEGEVIASVESGPVSDLSELTRWATSQRDKGRTEILVRVLKRDKFMQSRVLPLR